MKECRGADGAREARYMAAVDAARDARAALDKFEHMEPEWPSVVKELERWVRHTTRALHALERK